MPAQDLFHTVVKNALIKDGWTITHDPLFLSSGEVDFFLDLGAEKVFAAEREGRQIAVEVKSFAAQSAIAEFHTALGQFLNYRIALRTEQPKRELYLAVPLDSYDTFFLKPFTKTVLEEFKIKLLVYRTETEEVALWIS